MLNTRNNKSLSQRIDTKFHLRKNQVLTWRRWWSFVAVAITSAVCLIGFARSRTWYESRPVSTSHQFIGADCQRCHIQDWQPLQRLIGLDFANHATSTPNQACETCHRGPLHHGNQLDKVPNCGTCHREHRGRHDLVDVGDRFCGDCHGNLATRESPQAEIELSQNYVRRIPSWRDHPEFALARKADDRSKPGKGHGVHRVAVENTSPPDPKDPYERLHPPSVWHDGAQIKFNHAVHLNPQGIFDKNRKLKVLECQSCHMPDSERRYMQPIRYDFHCADCHAGQLLPEMTATTDTPASLPGFENTPVPHRVPEIVRGALQDRYTQYARNHDSLPDAMLAGGARPDRALPGQDLPKEGAARQTSEWVQQRMQMTEERLFLGAGGCRYCHTLTGITPASKDFAKVEVVKTAIPQQWLLQSVFKHDSHRFMTCVECHADVGLSRKTEHILLPTIDECRKCHQGSSSFASVAHAARADCVECHRYHHREGDTLDGRLNAALEPVSTRNSAQEPARP